MAVPVIYGNKSNGGDVVLRVTGIEAFRAEVIKGATLMLIIVGADVPPGPEIV
jgi:hypothetical protein